MDAQNTPPHQGRACTARVSREISERKGSMAPLIVLKSYMDRFSMVCCGVVVGKGGGGLTDFGFRWSPNKSAILFRLEEEGGHSSLGLCSNDRCKRT